MKSWQPIETAPKDGGTIVAVRAEAGHNGYSFIFWDGDAWAGYTCEDEKRYVKFAPTHWTALPALPRTTVQR